MKPARPGSALEALLLAAGFISLASCATVPVAAPQRADLLIVGGTVYDGVSEEPRRVDVAVTGDRISFIGSARGMRAVRTIDAAGLVVAPGFIDPHTHSDEDLASDDPQRRVLANHLMQGVTTIVTGNDGNGSPEVGQRLDRVRERGAGANVATYVGFGAVRRRVVGEGDRRPKDPELQAMRQLVASAMCDGALGFSTGLYYVPQSYSRTDEVVALAREAALRGGIYDSHLREEGSAGIGLLEAIDEAISVGRSAGLPVHIAHIKALGVEAHGQAQAAIARIEAARARGLRVTADHYPWTASGTRLTSAFVPGWALDGGRDSLRSRIADASVRPQLEREVAEGIRRRGGAQAALLTGGSHRGHRLDDIAREWSLSPAAAALRIIAEEGDAPIASFNMSEADVAAFRVQPWVVTGSDASAGHPRKFGSFARAWELFARERGLLTPGIFIRRSSGLTAEILGLTDRGVLRRGSFADIVLFDPAAFAARANYDDPTALAAGVRTVLINGTVAVDEGRPTGALAGRPLAKPRNPSWSCPN